MTIVNYTELIASVNPRKTVSALVAVGLTPRRVQGHGPSGFSLLLLDPATRNRVGAVIVSEAELDGGIGWLHASISFIDRDPSYDELKALKLGTFGPRRYAYQVFPSAEEHVNIHAHALHLWGRVDGAPILPRFGLAGTI